LWPTLSALWLAAHGAPSASLIVIFCWARFSCAPQGLRRQRLGDRRFDAHVERTARRPLAPAKSFPGKRSSSAPRSRCSRFLLVLATNKTTILLSIPALVITVAYPFFKRFFTLPQAFLGIAFSFGIPMA
jgi:4-hydroxybenzoate polyprenyltransferase